MSWLKKLSNCYFQDRQVNNFHSSSWLSLGSIIKRNNQLVPAVRTVVYRSFVFQNQDDLLQLSELPSSGSTSIDFKNAYLSFSVHLKSEKLQEGKLIEHAQDHEICWLFHSSGIQFRIRGPLYYIPSPKSGLKVDYPAKGCPVETYETIRRRIFDMLDPRLQQTFTGPLPGTPLSSAQHENTDDPFDNFVVGMLKVESVDILDVKNATRFIYQKLHDQWQEQAVVP